ncbi:MAG: kelch repeat-containing protein, partial [Elusimicrobiota bacterium]
MSLVSVRAHAVTAQVARYAHTSTLLADSSVLVTGGIGAANIPIDSVTLFRSIDGLAGPGADGYVTAAPLTTAGGVARASHTATLLPDGRVLVVGGVSDAIAAACDSAVGDIVCDTGHIYNPVTNGWTAVAGNMTTPRFNH